MAAETYVDLAVKSLYDYFSTNIVTALRAVETEQGLATYSLINPEIIKHRAPFDNRSPLIQIYENSWLRKQQNERLWQVDCTVLFAFSSSPDLEAGELFCRRYVTAMTRVLIADSTLSGTVVQSVVTDADADVVIGDKSSTRMLRAFGVAVDVYCPT